MIMSQNVKLVQEYFRALAEGNYEKAGSYWSDNLVWHQPGHGALSGDFEGESAVFAHLGNFAKLSNGTFAIDGMDYITDNDDMILASIHFKASTNNTSISMKGVDLFKIDGGKIQEIWLFSEDIDGEDKFWTSLVRK